MPMLQQTIFVIRRSDGVYLGCRPKLAGSRQYGTFVPRYLDAWAFDSREEAMGHFLPLREHWPAFRFSVIEV